MTLDSANYSTFTIAGAGKLGRKAINVLPTDCHADTNHITIDTDTNNLHNILATTESIIFMLDSNDDSAVAELQTWIPHCQADTFKIFIVAGQICPTIQSQLRSYANLLWVIETPTNNAAIDLASVVYCCWCSFTNQATINLDAADFLEFAQDSDCTRIGLIHDTATLSSEEIVALLCEQVGISEQHPPKSLAYIFSSPQMKKYRAFNNALRQQINLEAIDDIKVGILDNDSPDCPIFLFVTFD